MQKYLIQDRRQLDLEMGLLQLFRLALLVGFLNHDLFSLVV
jgi:hypothetical protein